MFIYNKQATAVVLVQVITTVCPSQNHHGSAKVLRELREQPVPWRAGNILESR